MKSTNRRTVRATSNEKKRKMAKAERERFHGKSSWVSSLPFQGSWGDDRGDGSTGTARWHFV
jgi:hypothetical protein